MGRPGEGPAGPAKGEPMSLHTDHDVAPATARLRALLHAGAPVPVLDAYDALSARIVESAGYSAIWASGLGISASYGLRDNNEASWTQILDSLELMAEATDVPILVDGDSGFGNFNNVRRFVKKIGQRGLAGVCIEDKAFPKANSFAERTHELCPAGEFCGKIRAAKDSQPDDDFVVVARTEALIAAGAEHARKERRLQAAQHDVAVGDRQRPAAPVARRAWVGARTVRPHAVAAAVEVQDRPAARGHGVDLHHGRAHAHPGDPGFEGTLQLAGVVRHVRRRPAHIERQNVRDALLRRDGRRPPNLHRGGLRGSRLDCRMELWICYSPPVARGPTRVCGIYQD